MKLDEAFQSACKCMFGKSLGGMEKYDSYLKEAVVGRKVKSSNTGHEMLVAFDDYPKDARFVDFTQELGRGLPKLEAPVPIDKIKDIDSLVEAVSERLSYSGNKVLGNSHCVELSDNVFDSSFVLDSSLVYGSKYVAHSFFSRESEFVFGSRSVAECTMAVRCHYTYRTRREFEVTYTGDSADVMFCSNVMGCSDCLFCFNLHAKRHAIGNIVLEKESYAKLRQKLVGEIADELTSKGKLGISIIDLKLGPPK